MPVSIRTGPGHRSKAFRRSGKGTRAIAKRALRVAKLNVPELKNLDGTALNGAQAATWNIVRMSIPAQGDTDLARDGMKVLNMSIGLQGMVTQHASATNTTVRIVVVQDRQNNGVLPVASDIFEQDTLNTFYQFSADNRRRFKIILDKYINLEATSKIHQPIHEFRRVSGRQTYNGTTNVDASAGANSLWVCFCSNEATNTPTVDCDVRFVFRDI